MAAILPLESRRAEHEPEGNCWENAAAESFFGSLKKERIQKHIYKNRLLATADVADYIENFCNRTRRHSHLGGLHREPLPLNPGNSTLSSCFRVFVRASRGLGIPAGQSSPRTSAPSVPATIESALCR